MVELENKNELNGVSIFFLFNKKMSREWREKKKEPDTNFRRSQKYTQPKKNNFSVPHKDQEV